MRYPAYLEKNGTIGFVAPSFGCATEPYKSAFESALAAFHEMGYQTMLGPNCYAAEGIGIVIHHKNVRQNYSRCMKPPKIIFCYLVAAVN